MRSFGVLGRLAGRSDQAAMFVAASDVPLTFQHTLMPRSTLDQGLVTGVAAAANYAFTVLVQDLVEAAGQAVSRTPPSAGEADSPSWRGATAALNAVALGTGSTLQVAFRQRPDEHLRRAAVRTLGYWVTRGATASLAVTGVQAALHRVDRKAASRDGDPGYRWLPLAIPASGLVAGVVMWSEHVRHVAHLSAAGREEEARETPEAILRSVAIAPGVTAGMFALGAAERTLAAGVERPLAAVLPGGPRLRRAAGHTIALGCLAGTVAALLWEADHRAEAGAGRLEPAYGTAPTSPLVSGSPDSLVRFETLSKQGRRHVSTALPAARIAEVMGEEAVDPIRIFVGLDSAPSTGARVQLALSELERTRAFGRDLLLLISPTGTGYVNPVAVESAEYLTRGDLASVTLQYSKRPSVMSLDRTGEGRRQFRMLVDAVCARLRERGPGQRPRLVVFGESLGAWTSQDAFLHTGTAGLSSRGVDRALWIGSPYESGWKTEVLHGGPPDVDRDAVGVFDHFGQLEALPPAARARLRYVMITHDNDAVASFGLDLLVQCPPWLGDPATRPATVPVTERWTTPTTFLQTLVDMKNSANVIPGTFEAKGHDYRADLARFVREVYALPATEDQLARIEAALRASELARTRWIDERDAVPR